MKEHSIFFKSDVKIYMHIFLGSKSLYLMFDNENKTNCPVWDWKCSSYRGMASRISILYVTRQNEATKGLIRTPNHPQVFVLP